MAVHTYLDFDLLIERAGDRYRARVLSSPGGSASRSFDLPFTRDQLQIFVLKATSLGSQAPGAAYRVAGDEGDQDLRQTAVRGGVRRRKCSTACGCPCTMRSAMAPAFGSGFGWTTRSTAEARRRDEATRPSRCATCPGSSCTTRLAPDSSASRARHLSFAIRISASRSSGSRSQPPASDPRHDLRTEATRSISTSSTSGRRSNRR